MSRSYKYHSYAKMCADSNKKAKITANKKFRRESKALIKQDKEPLHDLDEVSDTWDFPSDGLAYYIDKKDIKWGDPDEIYRKTLQK